MKKRYNLATIILISIGFFLILGTYFFYPIIYQNKFDKKQTQNIEKIDIDDLKSEQFENVEYAGSYNMNNPFVIKSEVAEIDKDEPDIVFMKKIKATIYMLDGRKIIITSDAGSYNKATYDCFFEKNVKATDGKTVLTGDNLDLIASKDFASIYNKVILKSKNGSLIADKINYDFETKYYQISMFNNEKVKIKLMQ